MSSEQPKEYIITEEELSWFAIHTPLTTKASSEMYLKVRSRPHPAPCNYPDMISCPNAILCSECNVNDIASAAARKAREDVLKTLDLWRIKRMNGMLKKDVWKGWNDETDFIESLRSTQQQAGEP